MKPKVIIHDRRFLHLWPDGRMVRIYANERIRAHLSQVRSVEVRMANEESPKRTNHPKLHRDVLAAITDRNAALDGEVA